MDPPAKTTSPTATVATSKTPKPLDGGWGWVIVVACFMAQFLAYGSPQSVGVLYPEWLQAFQEGKGMTAWVGSLVSGVGLIVSPICSACVVNFGARPVTIFSGVMVSGGLMLSAFAPNIPFLIFSYGIVVGIGCGLVYAATLTITCLYFDKKRGLALGIVTTGTSVGGFLYATLQNELIVLFGLHGCLLIIGALALNIIACAGPMRPLTPPKYYLKQRAAILERAAEGQFNQKTLMSEEPTKPGLKDVQSSEEPLLVKDVLLIIETKETLACKRKRSLFSCSALVKLIKNKLRDYSSCSSTLALLYNRVFMALCVSLFLFSLGAFPPLLFMEDVAQSEGLSEGVAAIPLVSLTAISAGAGKMGLGTMADLRGVNSVFLYAFTIGASGLGLLLIPVIKSYLGLQILSAYLGFLSGNWSLTPYVTNHLVGMEKLTEAHGILMFFGGFGIMLGPPVVGWFYDVTQSYDLAFYLSGGCVLMGGMILFIAALPCLEHTKSESAPCPEVPPAELMECIVAVVPDAALPNTAKTPSYSPALAERLKTRL
ncbi:monocarboxylate transporter 9-like isoform X2 [Lampris incognitus]|uniref:monocarboxylate transporter 9-like isoform X2 n=1 Tax=Lampris incognitus TaxID=2546036 RepID=UPI0024B51FCB|nr:monocarboxylate transporter 9-like isoform X2 [Lampris incognitus]